jgi:hypothetical protein
MRSYHGTTPSAGSELCAAISPPPEPSPSEPSAEEGESVSVTLLLEYGNAGSPARLQCQGVVVRVEWRHGHVGFAVPSQRSGLHERDFPRE